MGKDSFSEKEKLRKDEVTEKANKDDTTEKIIIPEPTLSKLKTCDYLDACLRFKASLCIPGNSTLFETPSPLYFYLLFSYLQTHFLFNRNQRYAFAKPVAKTEKNVKKFAPREIHLVSIARHWVGLDFQLTLYLTT
jgi:hypothetical protein